MNDDALVLRVSGLSKSYGSVAALKGVEFGLRRGEVMALLGENGAGKSTLVKILAGLEHPDSGQIEIGGRPVRSADARSVPASRRRLRHPGAQHHLRAVRRRKHLPGRPIAESDLDRLGRLAQRVKPYLELVGLGDIDPGMSAGKLSVAHRQLVEIARLLSRNAQILILDEPTAALSDVEIGKVTSVVTKLAKEGPFDHLRHPSPGRGLRNWRPGHDLSQRGQFRADRGEGSQRRRVDRAPAGTAARTDVSRTRKQVWPRWSCPFRPRCSGPFASCLARSAGRGNPRPCGTTRQRRQRHRARRGGRRSANGGIDPAFAAGTIEPPRHARRNSRGDRLLFRRSENATAFLRSES